MYKKEAEELVLKRFKQSYPEWKTIKSKFEAYRKGNITEDRIQFMMYDELDGWTINPYAYSYHHELEALFSKITEGTSVTYPRLTMGAWMAAIDRCSKYAKGSHASFDIGFYNLDEFEKMFEEFEALYERIEIKFWNEFRSLEAIDDVLNHNPKENTLFLNSVERRMKGILVAWMAGNPRLKELIDIYHLKNEGSYNLGEAEKKDFYKIVEYCLNN